MIACWAMVFVQIRSEVQMEVKKVEANSAAVMASLRFFGWLVRSSLCSTCLITLNNFISLVQNSRQIEREMDGY